MGRRPEGEYGQDVEDEVHGRIAEEEADGAAANQSAIGYVKRKATTKGKVAVEPLSTVNVAPELLAIAKTPLSVESLDV